MKEINTYFTLSEAQMIHENVQHSKQLFCNYSDEYEIGRLSVHV